MAEALTSFATSRTWEEKSAVFQILEEKQFLRKSFNERIDMIDPEKHQTEILTSNLQPGWSTLLR